MRSRRAIQGICAALLAFGMIVGCSSTEETPAPASGGGGGGGGEEAGGSCETICSQFPATERDSCMSECQID